MLQQGDGKGEGQDGVVDKRYKLLCINVQCNGLANFYNTINGV